MTANRVSAKKRNSSKPKHLGRKIAAIASTLSASETHANQASSDVQCADMSSHTQTAEAMMRQLEQQQQKLQTEKEVSQQKWKALVQVKLQETLARKEALMKAELRAARKKAARISESSSTDVNAVTEAQSSIKTLQARLVRLSPSGWDQNLFDTKFSQLAFKGLSPGSVPARNRRRRRRRRSNYRQGR